MWNELAAALHRIAAGGGTSADRQIVFACVLDLVMRKTGFPGCDLWAFVRHPLGFFDPEIRGYLWRYQQPDDNRPPDLVWFWSRAITHALLRIDADRCRCWEPYHDYLEPKKLHEMQKACERNHHIGTMHAWLAKHGRARSFQGSLEGHWLKNAVDGFSNLFVKRSGMFRAFGNSMLCAVFRTPAESRLVLNKHDMLVDERSFTRSSSHDLADVLPDIDNSVPEGTLILGCHHCRHVVGANGRVCRTPACYWQPSIVPQPLDAIPFEVHVARCQSGHLWSRRGFTQCPAPGCRCRILPGREPVTAFYVTNRYEDLF